jgi:hypothetical protein
MCLFRHDFPPEFNAQLMIFLVHPATSHGSGACPVMFGEGKVTMYERNAAAVPRQQLLIHESAEVLTVAALQILVDYYPDGA